MDGRRKDRPGARMASIDDAMEAKPCDCGLQNGECGIHERTFQCQIDSGASSIDGA